MKVFLCLLLPLLALVRSDDNNPLYGVWQGTIDGSTDTCLITVQFLTVEYLSLVTNCTNPHGNGAYTGLYFLASTQITVTYSGVYNNGSSGGPALGDVKDFYWNLDSDGKLHLSDGDQLKETFWKIPANSWDGIYSGQTTVNGVKQEDVVAEFWSNLYLSFPNLFNPNIVAFIGIAPSLNAINGGTQTLDIQYSLTTPGYEGMIGVHNLADFSSISGGFSLDHTPYTSVPSEQWKFSTVSNIKATKLEGPWLGYTNNCVSTVDFRSNLFRAYQTSCSAAQSQKGVTNFGTFLYPEDADNSAQGTLTLYYGYSNVAMSMQNLSFTFTWGQGRNSFHIVNSAVQVDAWYSKITTTSNTLVADINLKGDMSTFNSDEYISNLAKITKIQSNLILVRGKKASATSNFNVTTQFSDDQLAAVNASSAPASILKAASVGDYLVNEVTETVKPYYQAKSAATTRTIPFISYFLLGIFLCTFHN